MIWQERPTHQLFLVDGEHITVMYCAELHEGVHSRLFLPYRALARSKVVDDDGDLLYREQLEPRIYHVQ